MTPTTVNRQTLLYALHTLDVQQAHAANGSKARQAYYEGMRGMLDIILFQSTLPHGKRHPKHSIDTPLCQLKPISSFQEGGTPS